MKSKRRAATLAIHGEEIEKGKSEPVATPMYQTSTYIFPDSQSVEDYMVHGVRKQHCYARFGSPAQDILEKRFALIEGAERSMFFSSGMGAITSAILTVASPGDEVITITSIYGQAVKFLRSELPRFGITAKFVDIGDLYDLEKIRSEKTKLIYFETPTNPNLQIVDIKRVSEQAKHFGIKTIIDNTFASPINQRPLDLGIDVVVYSATKYIGGHSDILAGAVTGSAEFIDKLSYRMHMYGPALDQFAVSLLLRSLKTLQLRVLKQNEIARQLADFFLDHPKVKQVIYPGLPDDAGHEVAKKQMSGFGGMVTIDIDGGKKEAMKVADSLNIVLNAVSLGGVETLVSLPVITSHSYLTDKELERANISKGMIRISAGIEDINDLKEDFDQALNKI